MFALDDRTGNVLTTIALFAAVAGLLFAARATLGVFVLALLLAYLLDPLVAWVQQRLLRGSSRSGAIALVYASALLLTIGGGYALRSAVAGQMQQLYDGAPEVLSRVADHDYLGGDPGALEDTGERAISAVTSAASDMGWLLMVPVIAIFFLSNRPALIDGTVGLFARHRDRASVKRTVEKIDTMLAQYTRAQLALAGMTAAVYTGSMALLGFPYPLALGILAGALEFVPVVGWVLAAAIVLTAGWFAHAAWIWMAAVIGVWKLVENFVLSPRIMGDRLQLHPITVIFALMVGGEVGGLLGVLLSVPAAAVLRILWLERAGNQLAEVDAITSAAAQPSNP
ncbi:MAG TPA: AI-2E family transporter [Vicinamibacterales bacterium]|nr:AI-2E family transporter [Vicinamibacterales bacterium]